MLDEAVRAVGSTYRDFIVTKYLPLEELKSTLIELNHVPSGARVMHIANDDPENLFCLSFRTLPNSSNGVAHILEHTVLCGSKKFPVKDPFFAMTRRSLNTFMNALTGQDFTCYPASSQVEKDFYNLLEVYLDAVFHPELKFLSFLQEGWRLQFEEPKNPETPLQFHGVVYNEMKGSLSSSDARLWRALYRELFPDLPYSQNTGGDPSEIPTLTYEALKEFHQNFYHPSRCLFFFYGNLPLIKHLDFISEKTLHQAKKLTPLPPLPRQSRFQTPLSTREKYPLTSSETLEKKTTLSFAWLTALVTDQGEILALSLLDNFLMDNDASPLRLALLKSGLCTQAASYLDTEMSEAPWVIVCKGCDPQDAEKLQTLLFKSLKEITLASLPQDQIEAALHQLEFERTEIDHSEGPFGLTLFMKAALISQHGAEPENALLIHTLFHELREKLKDPEFLPNLIKKYFLENTHFVSLSLVPDHQLEQEEREEEKKQLETIRQKLTSQDQSRIIQETQKLSTYQEAIEQQSLDCLPKLSLKDVPLETRNLSLNESSSGNLSIFHHACFSNKILYADLLFDLPNIPREDLPLVSLFTRLWTELGCGGKTYAETLQDLQGQTGGVSALLSLHPSQENPDLLRPALSLKGKALGRNRHHLFRLFKDFVKSPDFKDLERIRELLLQHATALQNRLTKNALNYALQTALSGFSAASFVFDQWNGLPYYSSVLKWVKTPELLVSELARIQKLLLGIGSPRLVLSCDEEEFTAIQKESFYGLSDEFPSKPHAPWKGDYPRLEIASQVRFLAIPVAFTTLATRTIAYHHPDAPLLLLSTELLKNVVLHGEVREKGGAYGAEASYAPSIGNFYLYSFRDPHLAKTITSFQKALDTIGQGKFNEEELEEAKFGVLQTLDAPIAPSDRAMTAYSWKRSGRTLALRQEFRKKILTANRKEIANAVTKHLLPQKKVLVSFCNESLYEKDKKKLPFPLEILSIPTP